MLQEAAFVPRRTKAPWGPWGKRSARRAIRCFYLKGNSAYKGRLIRHERDLFGLFNAELVLSMHEQVVCTRRWQGRDQGEWYRWDGKDCMAHGYSVCRTRVCC